MNGIVILGSGFAALTAVMRLRKEGVRARITVVSPRDALHYIPSSIWIPAGKRKGPDLKLPLAAFFRKHDVHFLQASVTGLDAASKVVRTDKGDVAYDKLLIATGARFIRKLPGIEHAFVPCEGIDVAEKISARLAGMTGGSIAVGFAANPNEQSAVRGGPMFEYLFIIDTLLRQQGRRDKFKLTFFNPSDRPGARLGPKAVDALLAEMGRRDIATHLGHKMVRFEADKVVTEGGEIPADLILFMPGITGLAWLAESGLPLSPGGMVKADETCRVDGHADIWAAGDVGSFPGPDWMPKQAHQADLQADAAARNIAGVLNGSKADHRFKSELICIVDMLDKASVVYRTEARNIITPKSIVFHWLKRAFEGYYLRHFR